MKSALCLVVVLAPSRAFLVVPPLLPRRQACPFATTRSTLFPSIHGRQYTLLLKQSNTNDFNLDTFEQDLEASFDFVRQALDENANDDVFDGREFPTQLLEREIEDAIDYASDVVDELQLELEEAQQESNELVDADAILGDRSTQVVEYLSKGVMNAESFSDFIQKRQEISLLLQEATVEQARIILLQKQQEAIRLQREIAKVSAARLRKQATAKSITVGLDGCLLGCAIGLYAWAAIPQYLGDNVHPSLPAFVGAGFMACASIVASTSDTIVALAMDKIKFGFVSRSLFFILGSIVRLLVSIPVGVADNVLQRKTSWWIKWKNITVDGDDTKKQTSASVG